VTQAPKLVVIGIGNDYRHDDVAGLVVARWIKEHAPGSCVVHEQIGEGTALMQLWKDAGRVIAIDAVQSGAPAGTIHHFDPNVDPVPAPTFRDSTHAFGLVEAIALSRTLAQLPSSLVVYGIEGENFDAGTGISPSVLNGINKLVEKLRQEIGLQCKSE
jgi:hydrogenase maturation protease